MEKLHKIHFTLFLIVFIRCSSLSSAYDLPHQYFINCGSEKGINVTGRLFVSDHQFVHDQSKTVQDSSQTAETSIYQTARVFYRHTSSYQFLIKKRGTHVVMGKLGSVPPQSKPKMNSGLIIAGLLGGGAFLLISFLLVFFYNKACRSPGKSFSLSLLRGSSRCWQTEGTTKVPFVPDLYLDLKIPYSEIKRATKNFSSKLLIGKGGFGKVYRATLRGQEVAVKRSEPGHGQGLKEFQNEIMLLSQIRHCNLVSFVGYCDERSQMILVYEFMGKGTLRDHLYIMDEHSGRYSPCSKLTWEERLKVCIDFANGLNYLHASLERSIIHCDVKSTNILLAENYTAKVADFGISKSGPLDPCLLDPDQDHTIKGSFGYLDPEYFTTSQLTEKYDVYSFGVVLLEVLCARPAIVKSDQDEEKTLAHWGRLWQKKGQLQKIIDPGLVGNIRERSLQKFGETAEKCLRAEGRERPSMHEVLWDL